MPKAENDKKQKKALPVGKKK